MKPFAIFKVPKARPVPDSDWGGGDLEETGTIRLSEVVTALSTALDLTEGQVEGHAIRSALIGMRIGREIGLSSEAGSSLFYALLLKDLGCSSNAAKMAYLFGTDERVVKCNLKTIDWQRMTARLRFAASQVIPSGGLFQKILAVAGIAREGNAGARKLIEARCERGAEIAREIGFPEATAAAIRSLDEHWNGKGHPDGLRGDRIPLLARILNLAQTVEVFGTAQGIAAALRMAWQRRGRWFDPQLVDVLSTLGRDVAFWETVFGPRARAALMEIEPRDRILLADEAMIDRMCAGFARVVDAKSPWTHRHSEGVANIAVAIGREMGMSDPRLRDLHRAGLVHDLGKLGVSNAILDKPGKPTDAEFGELRMHPDYSEQILSKVAAFGRLADVASAHHERLDGRGYHRRLPGQSLAEPARILAVADVFEALTADRPYRPGMPLEKTLEIIRRESGTGLCPACVEGLEGWIAKGRFEARPAIQREALESLRASL